MTPEQIEQERREFEAWWNTLTVSLIADASVLGHASAAWTARAERALSAPAPNAALIDEIAGKWTCLFRTQMGGHDMEQAFANAIKEYAQRSAGQGMCELCKGTGWLHGVQCEPSKNHPTGWKSQKCDCQKEKK